MFAGYFPSSVPSKIIPQTTSYNCQRLYLLQQTCYKCRRTFASQKQLRIHATSCAWCVSCSRWADELHVLTCKYGEEQFASTKRPTLARLLCNHCGKFTHRNYMQKHLSRKHSVQPESWRRCEHPEVLSEVSNDRITNISLNLEPFLGIPLERKRYDWTLKT